MHYVVKLVSCEQWGRVMRGRVSTRRGVPHTKYVLAHDNNPDLQVTDV